MKLLRQAAGHWVAVFTLLMAVLAAGCGTTQPFIDPPQLDPSFTGNTFRVGDLVTIVYSGNSQKLDPHAERIKEDGTITPPFLGPVKAVGYTPGQLQGILHQKYVPRVFSAVTITVAGEERFFYVDGEVKVPGKHLYPGDMTIVRAIAIAGYFTDYAKRSKVRLTRSSGHTEIINVDDAVVNPERDVPVYPNDRIHVPRRIF